MKSSRSQTLTLREAMRGYRLYALGVLASSTTVDNYLQRISQLAAFLENPPLATIGPEDLLEFWAELRDHERTEATIRAHQVTARSFFAWATAKGLIATDPTKGLPLTSEAPAVIKPLSRAQVTALLEECQRRLRRARVGRYATPITHLRNPAIILILLDTGVRAGELARFRYADLEPDTGAITVRPWRRGVKSRPRTLLLGTAAQSALWDYLAARPALAPEMPLLASRSGETISGRAVRLMLRRLGQSAGLARIHPHRFRHTFALEYLRNGGDPFTLKYLLGHARMDMVDRYLALAQLDVEQAHGRASPADHWFGKGRK